MAPEPVIKPLPLKRRRTTFILLVLIFVIALPIFFLYATGYRFDPWGKETLVSTGGMYVAAERLGAEIFIDGELVRETRVFRRAFYAQNLDPKTHLVSVQKEGHHTWVKELPVYPHLVTEAEAFNLPLVPQVRVISKWQTATGSAIVSTLPHASTTNDVLATSTKNTKRFLANQEFVTVLQFFATSTASTSQTFRGQNERLFQATTSTSSLEVATTSKESQGVKIFESDGDVFASWVGPRDGMPYYYCAEPFPRYSTSTATSSLSAAARAALEEESEDDAPEFSHPVQTVPPDKACEPTIKLDRKWQEVKHFDFFPGSSDLVILALESGVYVIEVDNRSWQNVQPLLLGQGLDMRVENGQIYVYDGELIYQIVIDTE